MKKGGGHTKVSAWYGFKWERLWLDLTLTFRNFMFGYSWYKQSNIDYQRHYDIRFYFIFLTIGFMYFIDPFEQKQRTLRTHRQ